MKNNKSSSKANFNLSMLRKKHLPKKTKSREYRDDLVYLTFDILDNNRKVQHAAKICEFEIKGIYTESKNKMLKPFEVLRMVDEFTYHYENFCHRAFSYREKLAQFLNAVLDIELPEKRVNYERICSDSAIRKGGFLSILKKFQKNNDLITILEDRRLITHRRYYGVIVRRGFRPLEKIEPKNKNEFKNWCKKWMEQIITRAKRSERVTAIFLKINDEVAKKIINYFNQIKKTFKR